MSAPARLLSLRVQGFKSFAARTTVEFDGGISAIVGPNGAGKSNLADALRWALGEQGRALRSRRSEDVIFAGSEARAALGMADVTLVIDNSDGLLPVEYGVVELGRRLFRSGEGEYLLNGTRVRLRALEDLLEAAHLADNAFLFIGQGMVDQALALRPEERRPLFEEVAGVRRHDRRKRAAEARLVESEANLTRVRDVLAELRPQARRLAAQAEQQAARGVAASELAEAIVATGRRRWHDASSRLEAASRLRQAARTEVDGVIAELRAAEEEALDLGEGLQSRFAEARRAREALDEARAALLTARVDEARLIAERDGFVRDAARLEAERGAADARVVAARRQLALPLPTEPAGGQGVPDGSIDGGPADGGELDSAEAAAAAARRHLDEAVRGLEAAAGAEEDAEARASKARRAVAALAGERRVAEDRLTAARAVFARIYERVEALSERLRSAAAPAVPRGAEILAEGLDAEAPLRAAVEAALGAAAGGVVVRSAPSGELAAGGRVFVLRDVAGPPLRNGEGATTIAAALAAGGGRLADALRADPSGVARRLLERAVWVPGLRAALEMAGTLPPGWVVATVRGELVDAAGLVVPPPATSLLELHDERERLSAELAGAETSVAQAEGGLADADARLAGARRVAADADRAVTKSQAERRARLEAEAAAARRHELAVREVAWLRAWAERRGRSGRRAPSLPASPAQAAERGSTSTADRSALQDRGRLEGALAADLERLASIDRERGALAQAHAEAVRRVEGHGARVGELSARLAERERSIQALDLDEGALRERLVAAERSGRAARERLRLAEERARASEVDELEARMAHDASREQLLVELAGLGPIGLRALAAPPAFSGADGAATDRAEGAGEDVAAAFLEAALDALAVEWLATTPAGEPPSPPRLAALRRRYQELGAGNPFAAEEHAALAARLGELETQHDDLERAIAATRRLIGDLERTIVEQFQATFEALGSAFERRFRQLFGGGQARLALSDPDDPTASGVEIIARPPGKKSQPLAMLSGGERALTAVALLFAMLEVRPVPFCVLDEVDAALDEANIGRFAEALRELAGEIQFVVITHNRGTIEEADALYGVTIGDDAISRVVSLRLDRAAGAVREGAVAAAGSRP